MIEWIVTSSVLIGMVIGLRFLTKGRIPMGLRYGLWVLVLVRLLIPVSIPSSISIMNLLPEPVVAETPVSQAEQQSQQQRPTYTAPTPLPSLPAVRPQPAIRPQVQSNTQEKVSSATPISLEQVLLGIWIAGMVVTGCVLLFSNMHFALRLKRSRKPIPVPNCKVLVYQSKVLSTPCVHGLFSPKIYLTAETMDTEQRQHILLHEMTHLRQVDPLWSLLRCVCLVLHWYNPLVWIAAVLSRQDAELACDEAVIRRLGEDQRSAYGQTLVRMACTRNTGNGLLFTASTMHTTKKLLKERISMIAKKPRNTALALLLFVLVAAIAAGCTMTGSKQNPSSSNEAASSQTIPFQLEDITYIRHNGGFGSDFIIRLNKDGTFTYSEGSLSSYFGYGTWTLENGIVTLKDEKFTNRFRVKNGELTWLEENSTGFMYGPFISLADGDRFISQAGKPEQLTHIAELSFLPQDYMDGGPMACFVHVDGTTYVWDHKTIGSLYGLPIEEVGAVKTCDNTVIPTTELAACRIPKGTVLYKGRDAGNSKYKAIYYKLEDHPLYARLLPMEAYRGVERWWDNQATHDGKEKLTVDTLRKISEEHGKFLSRSHLTQYSYLQFNALDSFDYRLFQVDEDYRLLLVSAATVADIEAHQARFYHKDSPNYWVDLMTTDIDLYWQTAATFVSPSENR